MGPNLSPSEPWCVLGLGCLRVIVWCLAELSSRNPDIFKMALVLPEFLVHHRFPTINKTRNFPLLLPLIACERLLYLSRFQFLTTNPTTSKQHPPCLACGIAVTASSALTATTFTTLASSAVRCAATTARWSQPLLTAVRCTAAPTKSPPTHPFPRKATMERR